MKATERWRYFPLDRRYQISDQGCIRRKKTLKVRNPTVKQNGYLGVVLTYPGGSPKGWDLHYMVAITWIGPRPPKMDISHLNGNKLDNRVVNLAYESRRVNANKPFNKFCRRGGKRVLTIENVQAMRKDRRLSNQRWALKLKVSRVVIWKARTRVTWKNI